MRALYLGLAIQMTAAANAMSAEPPSIGGPDPLGDALRAEGYVCIAVDRLGSGYLAKTVHVNNTPVRMVIDTGASSTHLDPVRTKALNLNWQDIASPSPRGATYFCNIATIQIDRIMTASLRVRSIDVTDFNIALEAYGDSEIDGVIGADVLISHAAVIDYSRNRIFLRLKPEAPHKTQFRMSMPRLRASTREER
ncbi:MAG: retroviral-like aspartic protease family protein [Planctomycetaceae bacterium]|nr:retroviral-like aspartic protease family protein [Planctomycetaceae bacterium]